MSISTLFPSFGGILLIILTIVQIAPINLNPWSLIGKVVKFILRRLGKLMTEDIMDKLDSQAEIIQTQGDNIRKQSEDIAQLKKEVKENSILQARQRILRFSDDVREGHNFSKEHWDQILEDIQVYNKYCDAHPEFPNEKAKMAISKIKTLYAKKDMENDFD